MYRKCIITILTMLFLMLVSGLPPAAFLATAAASPEASHQQMAKLIADDGAAGDTFGNAVFLSGDWLAVGALGDNSFRGAVYLFERSSGGADTWGQVKKLTAADGAADDYFGGAIALNSDTLAVGASGDNAAQGAVYLFKHSSTTANAWCQAKKLVADDGAAGDVFGTDISFSGDTLVVGASQDNSSQGSVYLFERNAGGTDAWGQVKKLTAADGAAGEYFGWPVSLSGDTLAVGAIGPDQDRGAVYLFERNAGGGGAWGQVKKLVAADGAANEYFGQALFLSGDRLAVGAPLSNGSRGSVYLFERDRGGTGAWGQVKKLTATDGAEWDYFGQSVSLNGDRLVVGAYMNDGSRGAAYLFERNAGGADAWGLVNKQTAADGAAGDLFGKATSFSGDLLAVGAEGDDEGRGSAYLFTIANERLYFPVIHR